MNQLATTLIAGLTMTEQPMNGRQIFVAWLIVGLVALVFLIDFALLRFWGVESTFSYVLYLASQRWHALPYLVAVAGGMLLGHWFL